MIFLNYQKVCQKILARLPERQKEIIERRFGLVGNSPETLQKIGDDFGITRERVRQIEFESFQKLKREKEERELKKVFFLFQKYLRSQGGAKREDFLLADLGKRNWQNQVRFFLTLGDSFYRHPEDEKVYPFWAEREELFQKVKQIVNQLFNLLEKSQKPLPENHLQKTELAKKEPKIFFSSLEIAKPIEKGPLGEFGLIGWPEIKPRGVKDLAYLVLKKEGQPLHFTEIAKLASQLFGEYSSSGQVLPQTLHNELIRDQRFVLVGRGVYALREWGYLPGTVREIIVKILKDSPRPLTRQEILEEVQKQRLVRENTILLNLSNKDYFKKDKEGRYLLKNSKVDV